MTTAGWRVERTNHAGEKLAPMDYTHKPQAVENLRRARDIGTHASLWQWDAFTGQWQELTDE